MKAFPSVYQKYICNTFKIYKNWKWLISIYQIYKLLMSTWIKLPVWYLLAATSSFWFVFILVRLREKNVSTLTCRWKLITIHFHISLEETGFLNNQLLFTLNDIKRSLIGPIQKSQEILKCTYLVAYFKSWYFLVLVQTKMGKFLFKQL